MFLLVQEIVDEDNYNRLTNNLRGLHSICVGANDKIRLIFSDDELAELSRKVFAGVDPASKTMLVLLSDSALSPNSLAFLRAA